MMLNEKSAEQEKTGYIKGELLHTIFHNENEHFSIVKIKVLETNEEYVEKSIVAKGYFSNLLEDTAYSFFGRFEKHPKFGLQYHVDTYRTFVPGTKEGLITYLSSDLFYGIGKKTATRIVDKLGESAISKILDDSRLLSDIPGLKKETAETLVKTLQENQGFEHTVVYLAKYGIGLKLAQKIYKEYKDEAIQILEDDPYQYVFDIDGFGFQTADQIAAQNGLSLTHPNRIGAGCMYVLEKSIQEGHVYLPAVELSGRVIDLLRHPNHTLTADAVQERADELNKEKRLIVHEGNVYLPSLYYAEDGFVSHLQRITSKPLKEKTTLAELMTITGEIEEAEVISYGKDQFDAINQALHAKVMILTGGPGTGKTTVVKGILHAYSVIHDKPLSKNEYDDKTDYPFVLCAPTGRAAKRLTESTGLHAVTIHRLLGWDGKKSFEKNEQEQLTGKILIVDEFSMVDIWLANNLFKAIPNDMQVLLVGDEDQLPSVGPGQVLSDLLAGEVIPSVSLNEVYRQKEGSKIIQLAHEIKNDTCTQDTLKNDRDFSFIPCTEAQLLDAVTKIFTKATEKGIDPWDIQVLAPMYRTQAGITTINKHLQELVNPKTRTKREKKVNDAIFRVGDKVIQLVNQPEDGVFNGDIGEIVAIFEEDENTEQVEQLVIAFEEREVVYEPKDYINIMHAYCISIHKSQGSEFPIVLMPVVSAYRRMLRKNLLYTAITRSKQSLIICGDPEAFLRGIQTQDTNKRYTSLQLQLTARLEGVTGSDTGETDESAISPYDFL